MQIEGIFYAFLVRNLIGFILTYLFSALSFYVAAELLKINENSFFKAFEVVLFAFVIAVARDMFFIVEFIFSWIFILGLYLYAIKSVYNTSWLNSFFLWLTSLVVMLIISFFAVPFLFVF